MKTTIGNYHEKLAASGAAGLLSITTAIKMAKLSETMSEQLLNDLIERKIDNETLSRFVDRMLAAS